MQHSNLMPFFWAKLVAPALLLGLCTTGCAAGGGSLEGDSNAEPPFAGAPSAPTLANPTPGTSPEYNGPIGSANTASSAPAANAASTNTGANAAGDEDQAASEGDPNAAPPIDNGGEDDGEPAGANAGDDGADDDGAEDDDADDADDDGADDDDDDDAGDDDADDDGADADDTGVTPTPDPPTPNPPAPTPPAPAPDVITFTADIRPILVTECGRCHASGGLPTFASANADSGFDVAFRERNSIVSEIRSGSMPRDTCNGSPGSNGCVSVADFDLIQQWVAGGAPE